MSCSCTRALPLLTERYGSLAEFLPGVCFIKRIADPDSFNHLPMIQETDRGHNQVIGVGNRLCKKVRIGDISKIFHQPEESTTLIRGHLLWGYLS